MLRIKNTLLIFCLLFLSSYQLLLCSDISLEEPKYIIYQTELDQLKNNLNNIETEKNQISETLKLQTLNLNNLTKNLNNTEQMLKQSEQKTLQLENNLTLLSNKLKNQENTQIELANQLTTNQSQLVVAEQSLKEYKAEVKSQAFKNKLTNVFYLFCGIGIGAIAEKVIP